MSSERIAKSESMVVYSSLSNIGKESCTGERNFQSDLIPSPSSSGQRTLNQDYVYQSAGASNFYDQYDAASVGNSNIYDGYESSEDAYIPAQPALPEVNLKTVLSGIAAILSGRNEGIVTTPRPHDSDSTVEFLEPEVNGVSYLHSSVCAPSAPPLTEQDAIDHSKYREILEADPPDWLPDSCTTACMQCGFPFTALTRGRHHCRFCGQIFCRTCTKMRCLLPVKFRMRDPQRVCDTCYRRLEAVQSMLKFFVSNASQSAKHDVMDWTCTRGWLNLPIGLSMEHEIYKAANTLRSYCQVARLNPEKSIPQAVLNSA